MHHRAITWPCTSFATLFRGEGNVKRFIGWLLTLSGGTAALWGGVSLLTGALESRLSIAPGFAVNAMTGGLVGLMALTVGLIWVRD